MRTGTVSEESVPFNKLIQLLAQQIILHTGTNLTPVSFKIIFLLRSDFLTLPVAHGTAERELVLSAVLGTERPLKWQITTLSHSARVMTLAACMQ
jgi:hypothetical protein